MEPTAVLAFAGIALALIVVPGPDWAYILAAGARDHVVAPAVGGLMIGYLAITLVVAAGVGALVAAVPFALTGLTVIGAAYLTSLGIRVLLDPARIQHAPDAATTSTSPVRYIIRGIGVSALNPKGLLVFLSILPQFTRPDHGWPLPLQLAVLGGIFVALVAAVYFPLGHTASRVLGAGPRIAGITSRIAGCAMILVGIALVVERVVESIR